MRIPLFSGSHCTGKYIFLSDLQERENLIYVINSKTSRRRRRETSSDTKENLTQKNGNVRAKRVANSDDFSQTQTSDTLRFD